MNADIVVDLVNFKIGGIIKMVDALKQSTVFHYLYCSSCWAHGRAKILPLDFNDLQKEPLDEYGKNRYASVLYLKEKYRKNNFPTTIIMSGQISAHYKSMDK